MPDTRTITLVDLPLLRRLNNSIVLDSETGLTRDARGAKSALLSNILFPRGIYTLVARANTQQVVGQFRYRADDLNAHIVYLAPNFSEEAETPEHTVWLHILDAMAREAGKHGAHALIAEIEPDSPLFEIMRNARFATYARQTIWRHSPFKVEREGLTVELKPETSSDQIGIMALICSTIPTMLQQIAAPQGDLLGYVYRKNGQVEAYIALSEGAQGIYLLPFIHPDVVDEAEQIIQAAIAHTEHAARLPVYVCVRGYQSWLEDRLQRLGFERWIEQAIMVKHITARIQKLNPHKVKPTLETTPTTAPHGWWCGLQDEEKTGTEW
jgi:hypothetical protein